MRYLIALALLVFVSAQAEHHRDHEQGHLLPSIERMNVIIEEMQDYRDAAECPDELPPGIPGTVEDNCAELLVQMEGSHRYMRGARDRLVNASTYVYLGNLDHARRELNQPHPFAEEDPVSALQYLHYASSMLTNTVQRGAVLPRFPIEYTQLQQALNKVREVTPWALWHNNDAIREETYKDTAFGCCHGGEHNDADPEGMDEVEPEPDSTPTLDNGR